MYGKAGDFLFGSPKFRNKQKKKKNPVSIPPAHAQVQANEFLKFLRCTVDVASHCFVTSVMNLLCVGYSVMLTPGWSRRVWTSGVLQLYVLHSCHFRCLGYHDHVHDNNSNSSDNNDKEIIIVILDSKW